ncbi:SDR family NAD(P)-dependent oxidoreductase [Amycolatopsis sacchari]|uniref:SDR family NAD(P)-dependent oxidoreductase n=1 Tax=Amycolatopsis sacchari TaxID=115433 RepID=UPI003EC0AA77
MNLGLDDAVVLVTGAASGIGAAVAAAVAEHGGRPVLLDRDGPAVERAAEKLGPPALAIRTDVTDEESVRSAVGTALDRFGGIDVVVTCAGISGPVGKPLESVGLADWQAVFAVNVLGAFLTLKHALPALRASGRGAAVVLASDSALVAAPGMVPYCASKAALVQLARALSVETAGAVRVNALCPSVVDTPMSRADLGGFDGFPVHRPEDIAAHVLFLASPLAAGISGASLTADFGNSARSAFPA